MSQILDQPPLPIPGSGAPPPSNYTPTVTQQLRGLFSYPVPAQSIATLRLVINTAPAVQAVSNSFKIFLCILLNEPGQPGNIYWSCQGGISVQTPATQASVQGFKLVSGASSAIPIADLSLLYLVSDTAQTYVSIAAHLYPPAPPA